MERSFYFILVIPVLGGGRRADRGNVRRSIGRRADGGRRTTKGNGGRRTADGEKFLLRFINTPYLILKVGLVTVETTAKHKFNL